MKEQDIGYMACIIYLLCENIYELEGTTKEILSHLRQQNLCLVVLTKAYNSTSRPVLCYVTTTTERKKGKKRLKEATQKPVGMEKTSSVFQQYILHADNSVENQ